MPGEITSGGLPGEMGEPGEPGYDGYPGLAGVPGEYGLNTIRLDEYYLQNIFVVVRLFFFLTT